MIWGVAELMAGSIIPSVSGYSSVDGGPTGGTNHAIQSGSRRRVHTAGTSLLATVCRGGAQTPARRGRREGAHREVAAAWGVRRHSDPDGQADQVVRRLSRGEGEGAGGHRDPRDLRSDRLDQVSDGPARGGRVYRDRTRHA